MAVEDGSNTRSTGDRGAALDGKIGGDPWQGGQSATRHWPSMGDSHTAANRRSARPGDGR